MDNPQLVNIAEKMCGLSVIDVIEHLNKTKNIHGNFFFTFYSVYLLSRGCMASCLKSHFLRRGAARFFRVGLSLFPANLGLYKSILKAMDICLFYTPVLTDV